MRGMRLDYVSREEVNVWRECSLDWSRETR